MFINLNAFIICKQRENKIPELNKSNGREISKINKLRSRKIAALKIYRSYFLKVRNIRKYLENCKEKIEMSFAWKELQ